MGKSKAVRLAVLETKHEYESRISRIRVRVLDKALNLAAIETERRLTALNGEATRLAKILEQTMPRESAEIRFGQSTKDIHELQRGDADLAGRRTGAIPMSDFLKMLVAALIGGAVAYLIR